MPATSLPWRTNSCRGKSKEGSRLPLQQVLLSFQLLTQIYRKEQQLVPAFTQNWQEFVASSVTAWIWFYSASWRSVWSETTATGRAAVIGWACLSTWPLRGDWWCRSMWSRTACAGLMKWLKGSENLLLEQEASFLGSLSTWVSQSLEEGAVGIVVAVPMRRGKLVGTCLLSVESEPRWWAA